MGIAGSSKTLATTYKTTEHGVITHTAFSGSLRPSRQMFEYTVHDAFRVMDNYQCHPYLQVTCSTCPFLIPE